MGADLVACIKQNKLVRKYVNAFLLEKLNDNDMWAYWDKDHVYSKETFLLEWEQENKQNGNIEKFNLNCVLKKNLKNGKFRCFGTTKMDYSSKDILNDYKHRWIIENGIKDLVHSYFLDQCPGINPHNVNVHFLIISICKHLYSMIQKDCEDLMSNHDGTSKTLKTMRDILIKPSPAKITVNNDEIVIKFVNSFSVKTTNHLRELLEKINDGAKEGLKIIGGYKLKYILLPPYGEERKNSNIKTALRATKT